ncbi:MAG TPA: SH3 domain-containing protein [Candidatus Binatia bacterium]|nr:SH3 domain-containing protein [Candidatus Binatia bacterium]
MRSAQRLSIAFCWIALAIAGRVYGAAPASQPAQTYITTAEAQLREGPGTNHRVVATIPQGIKIQVVGRDGYWLKVQSKQGNRPGYIDERYARPLEVSQTERPPPSMSAAAGPYRTKTEVELRDGPGLNYKVLTRLPANIKIHVVRSEGEWLRIESKQGNRPGYVDKRSVERWSERAK